MAEPKKKPPGGLATVFPYLPYFRGEVDKSGLGARPDISDVTQEAADLRAYLGPTDYSKQLEKAEDAAKLQAALGVMSRGFASMGATPKRGESPFATIGRELLAPVGADLIPVSQKLMERKTAIDAARQAEDRQVKLAAYTQATARKKAQDDITVDLLKSYYANNKTSKDLLAEHFVITKSDGTAVIEGGVPLIGRQRKKGDDTSFIAVSGNTIGEKISMDGRLPRKVSDFYKAPPAGAAPTVQAADYRLIHTKGLNKGKPYTINGVEPIYNTISKGPNIGKVLQKGAGRLLDPAKLATQGLELQKIETPSAPKDPKGVDSAEAKANFEGFLNRFAAIQEENALADTSIKFDPFRHKAGQQPFTYLDGTALSDADGKRILRMIETDYFNLTKEGYSAGQEPVDINQRAVTNFLKRTLRSYGLKPPAGAPTGAQRPPSQLRSKQAQLTRYKTAPAGFNGQPVASETLDKMPVPSIANYKNGIGRLKGFQDLGVDFGPRTTSPPPLNTSLPSAQLGEALNTRSAAIANLSDAKEDIQTRIDAEDLSKGTSLAATLNSQANTPEKRDAVLGEALKKVRDARIETQNKPGNKDASKELAQAMLAYEKISKMRVLMSRSRVPGFVTGPLEVAGRKLLGLELGAWVRTPEGQKAANEFIATLPVMNQITTRQMLRGAGEGSRMSNRDLVGMQGVLPKAGQNFEYEVDKINALERHLKSGIQEMLGQVGDFVPSKALLIKAASLGFDLKSIEGKNNYYSPFLSDKKYRVSRQPVPTYSRENQTQLQDQGVLSFVAKSVPGQPVHFELMVLDTNGQPIWDTQKNKWQTTIVNEAGLKNPNNRDLIKFNTDWLRREHKLDR